jgi:hypothetical protein
MNRRLALTFACLFLAGCLPKAGTAPGPLSTMALESAKARWPETTEEEFEKGRQVFLEHCSSCHAYPDRAAYSEKAWPVIARRMGSKVDLPEADTERLIRFILAERAAPGAPAQAASEAR